MNKLFVLLTLILTFSFIACDSKEEAKVDKSMLDPEAREVVAKEAMEVASYTYVLVDDYGDKYWIAIPKMSIEIGETYYFKGAMEMKNFRSEELDKTFDSVLFVQELSKEPILKAQTSQKETPPGSKASVTNKISDTIEKAEGGYSIAEVYEKMNDLKGETIIVRGKVTKFNAQIMGRNWVHIQDGSEYDGNYDLTFTSNDVFEIGTVVTVKGSVATDQDFGFGYKYKLLLENTEKISLDSH